MSSTRSCSWPVSHIGARESGYPSSVRLPFILAVMLFGCQLVFPIDNVPSGDLDASDAGDDGSVPVGRCSTVDFLADTFEGTTLDPKWVTSGNSGVDGGLSLFTTGAGVSAASSQELYYLTESSFAVDLALPAAMPDDCFADVELVGADGRTYGLRVLPTMLEGSELDGTKFARGSAMYAAGPTTMRIRIAHTAGQMTWEVFDAAHSPVLMGQTVHDDPGLVQARLLLTCNIAYGIHYDNVSDPLGEVPKSCPIASLVDELDVRTEVGPLWRRSGTSFCDFTVDGQLHTAITPGASPFCNLVASTVYDLEKGTFGVELVEPPTAGHRVVFSVFLNGHETQVGFVLDGGTLSAETIDTGVPFNSTPYTNQRFWRFRGTPTTLFFETSATGERGSFVELGQTSDVPTISRLGKVSPRLQVTGAIGESRFERLGPY